MEAKRSNTKAILAVVGCFLLLFVGGGLCTASFGVYVPYIVKANGFLNTQATSLVTIRTIAGMVLMIFSDIIAKKLGHRITNALGILCAAIGFLIFSLTSNYILYCIGAVLLGFCFTMAAVGAPYLLNGWFAKKGLGTALGIATTASGVSTIVLPKVMVPIFETKGLSFGFKILAAFALLCAIIFVLIVNNPPKPEIDAAVLAEQEKKAAELKKQPTFDFSKGLIVLLIITMLIGGMTVLGTTSGLGALFMESYTPDQMSTLMSIYGVALLVGKLIYGRLSDVKGVRFCNYIFFACLFIGLVGVIVVRSYGLAIVAAILIGLGATLGNLGTPSWAKALSVEGKYNQAVKILTLVMSIGGMIAGILVGAIADISGTYVVSFIVLAAATLVSGILLQGIFIKTGKK